MKQRLIFSLMIAAASAAAPAMAQQHSVSGTIGGAHTSAASAATAATDTAPATDSPAAVTPVLPAVPVAPAAPAPSGAMAMTIPTPQPTAPSSGGGLLQTSLALLFVIGLMLGLAWLTKRFGPRNFGNGNRNIKLISTLSVGARERILVVEVGEQWIVVGASPGRMNALATLPRQESSEPDLQSPALPTANFAEWFKQTIDKRNGK